MRGLGGLFGWGGLLLFLDLAGGVVSVELGFAGHPVGVGVGLLGFGERGVLGLVIRAGLLVALLHLVHSGIFFKL